jgi:calcium-dependent protein kinase
VLNNDSAEQFDIKIIDFGLSRIQHDHKNLKSIVGTPFYLAPEVLDGDYSIECDNWSMGIIMYIMLSGYLPFSAETTAEVFYKIKNKEISFHHPEFDYVSSEAKDLIKNLLCKDKRLRYTCEQALKHPWFTLMKNPNL